MHIDVLAIYLFAGYLVLEGLYYGVILLWFLGLRTPILKLWDWYHEPSKVWTRKVLRRARAHGVYVGHGLEVCPPGRRGGRWLVRLTREDYATSVTKTVLCAFLLNRHRRELALLREWRYSRGTAHEMMRAQRQLESIEIVR